MSKMFSDDLQIFLDWLNEQIEPAMNGEDTPLNYVINTLLVKQNIFTCFEDAVCYLIVESFASNAEDLVFNVLKLRYDRDLTNDEISDLLLKIPIRYVMLLLK